MLFSPGCWYYVPAEGKNAKQLQIMDLFTSGFKRIKLFEKIILSLIVITVIVRSILNYGSILDLLIFGLTLSIMYFPLGFYFLGKPSKSVIYFPSIVLGLVYSLALVIGIFGALNIYGYILYLSFIIIVIIGAVVTLVFRLKSNKYDVEYIYAQFVRILLISAVNIMIWCKYLLH